MGRTDNAQTKHHTCLKLYHFQRRSSKSLDWYKNFIVEGVSNCVVMMYEGEILGIQTKSEKVELTVAKAEPAIRGNTSQTARKKVTLETGFELEVPLFIEEGDVIVVNTVEGTYCSRA